MAFLPARVTVGTTPTALNTATHSLTNLALKAVDGATTMYVGGANVTSSTGWPVDGGTTGTFDLEMDEVLYAVVASGSASCAVLVGGA